jgi:hypothetical protein
MTREEILHLPETKLLKLVYGNFGITVPGLEDTKYMSSAWQIVEALVGKGWGIDVRHSPDSITVDGYKFDNGPGTIFAQYGNSPNFSTVVEGICRTALIALLTTGEFQNSGKATL